MRLCDGIVSRYQGSTHRSRVEAFERTSNDESLSADDGVCVSEQNFLDFNYPHTHTCMHPDIGMYHVYLCN